MMHIDSKILCCVAWWKLSSISEGILFYVDRIKIIEFRLNYIVASFIQGNILEIILLTASYVSSLSIGQELRNVFNFMTDTPSSCLKLVTYFIRFMKSDISCETWSAQNSFYLLTGDTRSAKCIQWNCNEKSQGIIEANS